MVSITGIIMNILLVIMILLVLFYGIGSQRDLNNCLSRESPYCLSITCPCDFEPDGETYSAPCYGNAFRPGPSLNTFYCSGSNTLVDEKGNIINP